MRDIFFAIVVSLGVLVIGLWIACVVLSQPVANAQEHNPYWPFTVETQIRDI